MLYKKFGGDNFAAQVVGEAKLRQLKQVDVPYLSASGPGFSARKRGGTNEVWLDTPPPELPQSAIQYAVIGSNDFSFGGVNLDSKFKKKELWTGEYIGRGKTVTTVLPQVRIFDLGDTTFPMYTTEKPGALYFRNLFDPRIDGGVYIQEDTRIIARARTSWDMTQGNYGEPPVPAESELGWSDNARIIGGYYTSFWSGKTAFVGWVHGWQVYATPNVIWDGTADGNGMYRGKAVIDITIYRGTGDGEVLQDRVELEFPGGTDRANEVPGTITVLRPGVFVVLSGQSLLGGINVGAGGPEVHDITDDRISLWHTIITVDKDGEDWYFSTKTKKLHEDGDTVWNTTDVRYSKNDFIQQAARVASQSPGVLCEDEKSILYAISSPWGKRIEGLTLSRDFAVAYVRVGLDGLIQSGYITAPDMLKQFYTVENGYNKSSGFMPACDLLYCGQGIILSRVREFSSQAATAQALIGNPFPHDISWPLTNAPPLPKFIRVEFWRSEDNGATWSKMPTGNGLPDNMNVANIGIPSVVEASSKKGVKLAIPVRNEEDGIIKISKSKDGGVTWSDAKGGYPSIIEEQSDSNGGYGVDFFSLRGLGFADTLDARFGMNYSTEVLHDYDGDSPKINTWFGIKLGEDLSGTTIVNKLFPAYDKSLKEIVRVKIGSKDAPKDLVRPWIYDPVYKKPEEP